MSAPAPLTPAAHAALRAILQTEPFPVYVSRGFTGLGKVRITVYGPPQLSKQTFRRLKKAGWVRQLADDQLKGLWDISAEGLEALRHADPEIAAMSPRFADRRIEVPLELYGNDQYGFARRLRASDDVEGAAAVKPVARIGPEAPTTDSAACVAAKARAEKAGRTLQTGEPALGALANECLAVVEAFLKKSAGGGCMRVGLHLSEGSPITIYCDYRACSFDGVVPKDDVAFLNDLLSSLCRGVDSGLLAGDGAHITLCVTRRKRDGFVFKARLPADLSFRPVIDDVRAAVIAVGPSGLSEKPLLNFRYGWSRYRRRDDRQFMWGLGLDWSTSQGDLRMGCLRGPGRVLVNNAVWEAASRLTGVTRPPCHAAGLTISFA